ncbi:MAG: hypothetical protein LH473_14185 [Chitinophagales bacterium]|nr:hypothetical protein [Chitinophagales bacterium]
MKIFFALLFLFVANVSKGQLTFEKEIAVASQTYAGRAIETSDHHIVYCGTYDDATGGHLVLGKLDFNGNEMWQTFLDTGVISC